MVGKEVEWAVCMFSLNRRIKVCSDVLKMNLRVDSRKKEKKQSMSTKKKMLTEQISDWKKTLGQQTAAIDRLHKQYMEQQSIPKSNNINEFKEWKKNTKLMKQKLKELTKSKKSLTFS